MLLAGDFNIPRASWLSDEFLAASGLIDPLAGDMRPTVRLPREVPARHALPGLQAASNLLFREKIALDDRRQAYLSDHCGVELQLAWESANVV